MILCDEGIILVRRLSREYDRYAGVYTKEHGRITLRFGGSNRPGGKLKAASEPLAWCDYRIHLKPGSGSGMALGAKLHGVFSGIRSDYAKTCLALHFCELMLRLTPERQPSPDKYFLLLETLRALDSAGEKYSWFRPAFILRLLDLGGFGIRKTALGIDAGLWDILHSEKMASLADLPGSAPEEGLVAGIAEKFLNEQLSKPLKTSLFMKKTF